MMYLVVIWADTNAQGLVAILCGLCLRAESIALCLRKLAGEFCMYSFSGKYTITGAIACLIKLVSLLPV